MRTFLLGLWVVALVGTGYGIYAAFVYDGGTAQLFPFAIAAVVGAVVALAAWLKSSTPILFVGFLLMAIAPTGFAWIGNLAAILGAVLTGWHWYSQWKSARRGAEVTGQPTSSSAYDLRPSE